jgi:hypothetical protein
VIRRGAAVWALTVAASLTAAGAAAGGQYKREAKKKHKQHTKIKHDHN